MSEIATSAMNKNSLLYAVKYEPKMKDRRVWIIVVRKYRIRLSSQLKRLLKQCKKSRFWRKIKWIPRF